MNPMSPVRRISAHPRQLWWVTFNENTTVYSLWDAWKGEVAASENIKSIDAATSLLCDVPLHDWPGLSEQRMDAC